MRWMVASVIGLILLVGVGGVALAHFRSGSVPVASVSKPSTCAQAYKLLALRPSQITAAQPVCLVQSLKFSGELTGAVAEAYPVDTNDVGPTSMCTEPKRWDGYPQALLAMVVGAKAYRLRITAPGNSEHQSLVISNLANVVELAEVGDPKADWNQATGTVTLNSDGITGTIDADLLRDVAGAQPLHVKGAWACGAPQPLPTVDASAPCASFYALNQLQPSDIARMKASACNTQDLSFSGDIAIHLTSAVTDTTIPGRPGYQGDNFCGAINDEYGATLKFSFADESFLLDLGIQTYPSVGPGQYSAHENGSSIGVMLFLGQADASDQGRFVPDDQVFWLGRSGTFTINPDMKSGTLDAVLAGPLEHAGSTVHISGSWRCAA